MQFLEKIRELLRGQKPLESVPYEVLVERHSLDPEGVCREFMRRLQKTVFFAALDYSKRQQKGNPKVDPDDVTSAIFMTFFGEFNNGSPESLLTRFAGTIRRYLDEEAFSQIAYAYYRQIPLYHIEDDEQRKYLAALFDNEATKQGKSIAEEIADRFQVSATKAESVIEQGRTRLNQIIQNDFDAEELRQMTEGRYP